ncbi:MAG: decarboxylating NADP(+)-dependent phosphogluconate dehydrogenase [Planctomycetota bacterium]|jgi:6-phosphogluconate dehydrogenase
MAQSQIGLVGLAVMGENLVLNMESKGFSVSVYNRTTSKVTAFIEGRAMGKKITGTLTPEDFVQSLERPRRIMILVKAGGAVDAVINQLVPLLDKGDILIDGGNSHFPDTIRRTKALTEKGILYIGTGVSGGEEGALLGPAIMPGGNPEAWPHVKEILQATAAKAPDGSPCCEWLGPDGAGHFVKMTHNGIEYGDMQLICEAYNLMEKGLGMSAQEMHEVFKKWNEGVLDSYLIEITRAILGKTDDETGKPMVDVILDTAGQKGTGKWTSQAGLDMGTPIPQIAEAVFARCLSAIKEERVAASKELVGPEPKFEGDRQKFLEDLHEAVYASKICSYAQGYQLLRAAAAEYGWELNYGTIALMWRAGCIIRARFLDNIKQAFDKKPDLPNLLLDPYFKDIVTKAQDAWRNVVKTAVDLGLPVPAMSTALSYYDSYRAARLPANLLQAQRDYFGAHTYERVDKPRGEFFHTNWTGRGGTTAASEYTV